ncbi:MAG TPA: hypothetical protein VFA65_24410 [Bryobacteraceae bacterium]|nr:hypothetical protein [Bryobacteraceae bacterium]
MDSLLERHIARRPLTSQQEACALTVRQSLAALGPCEPSIVRTVSVALAKGLFGEAFNAASDDQRRQWIDLMESEYRAAANLDS